MKTEWQSSPSHIPVCSEHSRPGREGVWAGACIPQWLQLSWGFPFAEAPWGSSRARGSLTAVDTIIHDPRKQSPPPLGLRWLHCGLHTAYTWPSCPGDGVQPATCWNSFSKLLENLCPGKGAVFFIPSGQRSGFLPDQPGKQQRSLWANFLISQSLAWLSAGALGWETVFLGDYFCFQPLVLLSRLLNGGLRVNWATDTALGIFWPFRGSVSCTASCHSPYTLQPGILSPLPLRPVSHVVSWASTFTPTPSSDWGIGRFFWHSRLSHSSHSAKVWNCPGVIMSLSTGQTPR